MLIIIDNTLTAIDHTLPSKEDLHSFCEMLFTIGVDIVELSEAVYEKMGHLPEKGKYYLHINSIEAVDKYPGFYGYTGRHIVADDRVIPELHINDPRELMKLKLLRDYRELRITGLDDILCHSFDKIFNDMINTLPDSSIHFCPENHYHCAAALAVLWLSNYGNRITSSFAGHKNNAPTEEVLMAMRLSARHKPNHNLTVLPQLSSLYERISGRVIGRKKPILGRNIFKVEAGIHADGIMKNPATYEAYDPGCVGQRSELVVGKHSGTKAIKLKLSQMQLPIPKDEVIIKILNRVKLISLYNNASLKDSEFASIVKEVLINEGSQIHC